MRRSVRIHRVEVISLPAGSDADGWEPPGWHLWCYENGRAESAVCGTEPLEPGENPAWRKEVLDHMPFRWPSRRYWFSKSAAGRCAARFRQWGGDAAVITSDLVTWASAGCPGGCHEYYDSYPCVCPCHDENDAGTETTP